MTLRTESLVRAKCDWNVFKGPCDRRNEDNQCACTLIQTLCSRENKINGADVGKESGAGA